MVNTRMAPIGRLMWTWQSSEAYTENHGQLKNAESGRNGLSHGKAFQLVTQYKMIIPEITYK